MALFGGQWSLLRIATLIPRLALVAAVVPLLAQDMVQDYAGRFRTSIGIGQANAAGPATVALGKRLFFDPRLSADGSLSCAGCHVPAHAFTDSRAIGVGVYGRMGTRRVPSLIGRGFGRPAILGRACRNARGTSPAADPGPA